MGKQINRLVFNPFLVILLIATIILPGLPAAAQGEQVSLEISKEFSKTVDHGKVKKSVEITEKMITEQAENEEVIVNLSLTGTTWASDFENNNNKKELLLKGLTANVDQGVWNGYREGINLKISSDKKTLTLKLPKDEFYKITNNQTITVDINPVLVEDWPGYIMPVEFTIYAKPRISLGGTIMNSTFIGDIQKGGKEIELSLVNAIWDEDKISKITNFNEFLNGFNLCIDEENTACFSEVPWGMAKELVNTDPNKVVTYSDDKRTLKLKLPANPGAIYTGDVRFKLPNSVEFYKVDEVQPNEANAEFEYGLTGTEIDNEVEEFKIISRVEPSLSLSLNESKESEIKRETTNLTIEIAGTTWAIDSAQKKQLLIDSLVAKDQPEEWQRVKSLLQPAEVKQVTTEPSKISIKIPAVSGYELIKDQTISLKVPHQLLQDKVPLPEASFIIKAQPKVLISGDAQNITPLEFTKGGKKINLTLVNASWKSDVASNTSQREKLIDAFVWGNDQIKAEVKARGTVERPNDKTVSITLPNIVTKFSGEVKFNHNSLTDTDGPNTLVNVDNNAGPLVKTTIDAITIKQPETSGPRADISWSEKGLVNDYDLIHGDKTITIVLKDDYWAKELSTTSISIPGSNIEVKLAKRVNDSTATFTLIANNSFSLNAKQNYSVVVNQSALAVSLGSITIDSALTVDPIALELSGTAKGGLDAQDIQKGGKTIILTLKNAEFKQGADVTYEKLFGDNNPWKTAGMKDDINITKNKITVKLPAVPNYNSSETVNPVILAEFIEGGKSGMPKKFAEAITIGAIGSVKILGNQFSESDIQTGKKQIRLTLTAASWDPAIETVKSKKLALMKGFATADQTKEWGMVTAAVAESGDFKLSDNNTLVITLPAVTDYSIVRDQIVNVTIPKSVLSGYKYDISGAAVTIEVPEVNNDEYLPFHMELPNLTTLIQDNGLGALRVYVPEKLIYTVTTNTAPIGGQTLTTITVVTSDAIGSVGASSAPGSDGQLLTNNGTNTFTFVFDGMEKDSTIELKAFVRGESEASEVVMQKIASGKKTYTKNPKAPLHGSHALETLLTDNKVLTNILKYYALEELQLAIIK